MINRDSLNFKVRDVFKLEFEEELKQIEADFNNLKAAAKEAEKNSDLPEMIHIDKES